MDVFLCTVLLALLQANLGVHSLSDTQNAQTAQPAVPTLTLQSTSSSSPPTDGVKGTSTEGEEKQGHKPKSVTIAVQTPPEFYKPQRVNDITLAFYKTVVRIMERLSHAFHKIYRDVEKFKRKFKPNRI
ncbi:unnamed protein product [Trichobilharzia regenti]|uniref:MUC1 n=1 Tax=Trichobilharzia regenti TaxID=157069 RepID=A0A183VPY0_TRIRE|nr:unnamed protein product [Trichobilharzia regenti]VDP98415.1 unnamed protein product [Trichobilharzia regenti]